MLLSVDDLMPIGEFSERSGLSQKRLRSYAAGGLLIPAAVDSTSGYRYYSPGQLRDARLIDALREAGMPLADIRSFLADPSGAHLDAWVQRVNADAAQRHDALVVARRLVGEASSTVTEASSGKGQMTKLRTASRMEVGAVRDSNEDAVVASDRLAAVADGMGGHPGGEIAAAVAVALTEAAFTGRSVDELEAAARAANRVIWDRAAESPALEGMGTTLCAAGLTFDGSVAVINVGDSRAYLLRNGSLRQLTDDHSVTGDLVRRGELRADEARSHAHHGVLTRVLGVAPDVEPDSNVFASAPGDRLLVCSDGLFNEVEDSEIESSMATGSDPRAIADALVDLALARGAPDNISAVVAEVYA